MSLSSEVEDTKEHLQLDLRRATGHIAKLESELEQTRSSNLTLKEDLAAIESKHAEEIRTIRFELGEAQETLTQRELMTEQLASDLVDTRTFRDQLERALVESEKASQSRIEELERENRRLEGELEHDEEQLKNKNEAINCLLTELATKSQQIEGIGEIEEVIQDIDDRMSDRIHEQPRGERGRLSRVLIGTVDGQELRFPLFKDRLTIGRTNQNDIQLKASYVSRRHAVIVTDQASTRVIDWGSRNGVFVNGERVTEHFLRNGDTVKVGTAEFRYEERAKRDA
jgi:predicted  nucleic acid-binding Zn-ribbon protein